MEYKTKYLSLFLTIKYCIFDILIVESIFILLLFWLFYFTTNTYTVSSMYDEHLKLYN